MGVRDPGGHWVVRDLLDVVDQLRERGIDLVVLKQQIDKTTPACGVAFHVMAAIDEFQRELIVEGTMEGLAAARARGRTGGRKAKLSPPQGQAGPPAVRRERRGREAPRTVEEIGAMFSLTRTTICRALARRRSPSGSPGQA